MQAVLHTCHVAVGHDVLNICLPHNQNQFTVLLCYYFTVLSFYSDICDHICFAQMCSDYPHELDVPQEIDGNSDHRTHQTGAYAGGGRGILNLCAVCTQRHAIMYAQAIEAHHINALLGSAQGLTVRSSHSTA